jgi:hypothetical protein
METEGACVVEIMTLMEHMVDKEKLLTQVSGKPIQHEFKTITNS